MTLKEILDAVSTLGTLGFALLAVYAFFTDRLFSRGAMERERADKREAIELARAAVASQERLATAVEARNRLEEARSDSERGAERTDRSRPADRTAGKYRPHRSDRPASTRRHARPGDRLARGAHRGSDEHYALSEPDASGARGGTSGRDPVALRARLAGGRRGGGDRLQPRLPRPAGGHRGRLARLARPRPDPARPDLHPDRVRLGARGARAVLVRLPAGDRRGAGRRSAADAVHPASGLRSSPSAQRLPTAPHATVPVVEAP